MCFSPLRVLKTGDTVFIGEVNLDNNTCLSRLY
jgi:hypothetical protein